MNKELKVFERDTFQARCRGFVDGYARIKEGNTKVSANTVTKKDGPFYCPVCLSDAIVRKCTEKTDHFVIKED